MTDEMKQQHDAHADVPTARLRPESPPAQRSQAETMLILANMTVALIELNVEERSSNGNA